MRLRMFATLIAAALLFSVSLTATAAHARQNTDDARDPITGEWEVSFFIAQTTTPGTFKLKLEGGKVTATVYSHHTGPGTLRDGSWMDGKLKFTLDFASHESIEVTGALKDGNLEGEFATEGMKGTWKASKKESSSE